MSQDKERLPAPPAPNSYLRNWLQIALVAIRRVPKLAECHPATLIGAVIESLTAAAGDAPAHFYRTAAGAEVDLVFEGRGRKRYAVEIKRSTAPAVSKGFWTGCADLEATESIVTYLGDEPIPLGGKVRALGLRDALEWVRERVRSDG